MSYDRFSSWGADDDQEKEEEVVESLEDSYDEPQPEPVADPEPVESTEADEIIEKFRSLDIGESLRVKADKSVFIDVYRYFRLKKHRKMLPAYQDAGFIKFTKTEEF